MRGLLSCRIFCPAIVWDVMSRQYSEQIVHSGTQIGWYCCSFSTCEMILSVVKTVTMEAMLQQTIHEQMILQANVPIGKETQM